jgi:LysM repeat protein
MKVLWKRRLGAIAVIVLIVTALLVPAASAGGTSGCRTYYKVRRGDTLTKIAYRYGTSVAALQQCNGI